MLSVGGTVQLRGIMDHTTLNREVCSKLYGPLYLLIVYWHMLFKERQFLLFILISSHTHFTAWEIEFKDNIVQLTGERLLTSIRKK